jgi:hypothetical protein
MLLMALDESVGKWDSTGAPHLRKSVNNEDEPKVAQRKKGDRPPDWRKVSFSSMIMPLS